MTMGASIGSTVAAARGSETPSGSQGETTNPRGGGFVKNLSSNTDSPWDQLDQSSLDDRHALLCSLTLPALYGLRILAGESARGGCSPRVVAAETVRLAMSPSPDVAALLWAGVRATCGELPWLPRGVARRPLLQQVMGSAFPAEWRQTGLSRAQLACRSAGVTFQAHAAELWNAAQRYTALRAPAGAVFPVLTDLSPLDRQALIEEQWARIFRDRPAWTKNSFLALRGLSLGEEELVCDALRGLDQTPIGRDMLADAFGSLQPIQKAERPIPVKPKGEAEAWLGPSTRTAVRSIRREARAAQRRGIPWTEGRPDKRAPHVSYSDTLPGPTQAVDRVELAEALAHLGDQERVALERHSDGVSFAEIARELDITDKTAKARVESAKSKLLKLLD